MKENALSIGKKITEIVAGIAATGTRLAPAALRDAVWEVDSDVPVPELRTLRQVMAESVAQRRFQMTLVGIFAAAALALAGLGIYGVVSYSVTRRRAELGIRQALGAGPAQIWRMVLRQGMVPVVLGLTVGIAGALCRRTSQSS